MGLAYGIVLVPPPVYGIVVARSVETLLLTNSFAWPTSVSKWGLLCMCKYNSVPESTNNNLLLLCLEKTAEDYVGNLFKAETR